MKHEACGGSAGAVARGILAALIAWPLFTGCVSSGVGKPKADPGGAEAAIRGVLAAQVEGWNQGSIDDFMRGYEVSPDTRFASGGDVTTGWETVRGRYRARYGSREAMGRLEFGSVDVRMLSGEDALVFGRWKLVRSGDAPSGLFTLLMRRAADGWRVVHDHTSSAP